MKNNNHVEICIFKKDTRQCIASSKVFHPSLIDKKIGFMIEEVGRLKGAGDSLTVEDIDIKTSQDQERVLAA